MRQAGIIAAGAAHALEAHRERLHIDHDRATALAHGLARHDAFDVAVETVQTNIVMADVRALDAATLAEMAAEKGVRFTAFGPTRLRFVTHLDLPDDAVERALQVIGEVLAELPRV